jgi:hypothetical protein
MILTTNPSYLMVVSHGLQRAERTSVMDKPAEGLILTRG